jgi:hypothetical protein
MWAVTADGTRAFRALLWTGGQHKLVIDDQVAASKE